MIAACGGEATGEATGDEPDDDRHLVLATTSVWADVLGEITCDGEAGVSVEALMPAGVDPHQYESSLQDRQRLDDAGLVVANGAGLEAGATALLEAVEGDRLVTVTELPGLGLLRGEQEEGSDASNGHQQDGVDPHVWLDPTIVAATIDPLVAFVVASGEEVDVEAIAGCADAYRRQLQALDKEIAAAVGTLAERQRVLVTNHDAYGYFADRYGFEVVGTVIPSTSTQAETNAADLEELVATIERHGIPAIFVDDEHDGAEAENLAGAANIEVVRLHGESLDAERADDGDGASSYVELLRTDATAIVDALDG